MTVYRFDFEHWDAYNALTGPVPENGGESRSTDNWFSTVSYLEACELLRVGWIDAVATLNVEPTISVADINRPIMEWSDEGTEIDIGAYLSGEEECMGRMVNLPQPKSLVRIGIDNAVSGATPTDEMLSVGRSVLTVVESLRARGYPTEIWACMAVHANGATFNARCLVQAADAPVHVGRIGFWAAHPAALRRAWFALAESTPPNVRNAFRFKEGGSYGIPASDFAKSDFDEWAPSAQRGSEHVARWVSDVLGRRN